MISHGSLATDFETTWFILFEPLPVSLPSSQSLSTFVSRGIYNSLFGKVSIQLFLYLSTKLLDPRPSGLSTSSTTVQWSPRSNCPSSFRLTLSMSDRRNLAPVRSDWPTAFGKTASSPEIAPIHFLIGICRPTTKFEAGRVSSFKYLKQTWNLSTFLAAKSLTDIHVLNISLALTVKIANGYIMIHHDTSLFAHLSVSIELDLKQLILMLGPMMANSLGWWSGARGSQQPQRLWRTCFLGQAEQLLYVSHTCSPESAQINRGWSWELGLLMLYST